MEFIDTLTKELEPKIPDATELATFVARGDTVEGLVVDNWNVVSIARLIFAVSGLPRDLGAEHPTIGSEAFLARWAATIARYLAAPDPVQEAERLVELQNAMQAAVARFGSVGSMLLFELSDTLAHLVKLRHDLSDVPAGDLSARTTLAKN